jgi:serine phosphatase RsbU (regulator of sigma subunit)
MYSFQPSRLGYIVRYAEPFNAHASLDEVRGFFDGNPEISSVPIETESGLQGLFSRETCMKKADSPLAVLRGRSLDQFLTPDTAIFDAMESVDKVLETILAKEHGVEKDFLIFHNRTYLGIGTFMDLIRHTTAFRTKDMAKARVAQEFLMNLSELPKKDLLVARYVKMVHDLGGDFFQYLQIRPGVHMVACFDVAGKGVAAALTTSMLSSFFSTLQLTGITSDIDPLQVVTMLNSLILKSSADNTFVAAAMIFIDTTARKVQIYNNALGPLYIFHQSEAGKPLCSIMQPNLPPLGIDELPEPDKNRKILPILNDMKVVMFSDGLTDARDGFGTMFGEERLKTFLYARPNHKPQALINDLAAEINGFIGTAPQADDITAIVFEVD